MFVRILTGGMCLLLGIGCAKKGVKNTAPAPDAPASVKLQEPPPAPAPKKDEPNWLKDDRFGQKDKPDQFPPAPAPAPGTGVLQPTPVAPPPVAATPAIPAARVERADMQEVWTFIQYASGASGKMPPAALTYAALVEAKSPAAALVKTQAIVLTGAAAREGVWAFEARARLSGGLVATQNGVETLTAAELQQRLKK